MGLTRKDGVVQVRVKVVPNASRTEIVGMLGEALKIKVAQPPEGGKANGAVVAVIAEMLGVAVSQVVVVAGHSQARKTVAIRGVSAEVVRKQLGLA